MAENKLALVQSGLTKKAAVVPSKQTINFAHQAKKVDPVRLVLFIVLALVVLAAAVKFGVLDQEAKRAVAESQLADKQAQMDEINAKLGGYDELAAKYGRYSYGWMNENETGLVNRMDVLKLLEDQVMRAAIVEDFSISDNVLTLNIHGITLERASSIVKELENSPLVKSASVYSASAEEAQEASIFMSVILTKEAAE